MTLLLWHARVAVVSLSPFYSHFLVVLLSPPYSHFSCCAVCTGGAHLLHARAQDDAALSGLFPQGPTVLIKNGGGVRAAERMPAPIVGLLS